MNDRADVDDDTPISPADALAIIDREQSRRSPRPGVYFVVWGVVLLIVGLVWFAAGLDMLGYGAVGYAVAGVVTGAVILVGFVASFVLGVRQSRGVSGPTSRQGWMFGTTWFVVFALLSVLIARLQGLGLDEMQVGLLIPALYSVTSGALYMLMGAIWRFVPGFVLGIVIIAVGVGSVFAPLPWNSLVIGLGIGLPILAVGCWQMATGRP